MGRLLRPPLIERANRLAMVVPPTRGCHDGIARTLQLPADMPRKQRFKPSRKPQSTQATVANQQVADRRELNPDAQDIQKQPPVRDAMPDVERDHD